MGRYIKIDKKQEFDEIHETSKNIIEKPYRIIPHAYEIFFIFHHKFI